MKPLRVGVVGVGHLGRHHARIVSKLEGATLVGVADANPATARSVAEACGCEAFEDYRALLDRVDAVSIAVPTRLHREVASPFLERGIPALVEKPLAGSLEDAQALVDLADRAGVVLQVGHSERFNPALATLESVNIRPKYVSSERLSTYTFRSTDIGVVHDLMIHDLDLLLAIVRSRVVAVSALGVSVFGGLEDIASARVWFEDGVVADLSASRVSMHAVRTMRMWGSEGFVALDFGARNGTIVRPSEKLRRGEIDLEGVDRSDAKAVKAHLFGKVLRVDQVQGEGPEPLRPELEEFLLAVREGVPPQVTGHDALRAMTLADQILKAIEAHPWEGLADGPVGPKHLPEPMGEPANGIPEPKFLRYGRVKEPVKE